MDIKYLSLLADILLALSIPYAIASLVTAKHDYERIAKDVGYNILVMPRLEREYASAVHRNVVIIVFASCWHIARLFYA
jgi:hypothetical protein